MQLKELLKSIETRTEIHIINGNESWYYTSYTKAIADLERSNPKLLNKFVIEVQATDYKYITIIIAK